MVEWFGLRPTGRQFREPAGTLVELEDAEGLRYTAIAFDEAYRGHPAVTRDIELVLSFLEYPMVVGLVELAFADLEKAVFAYPTGSVWSVKEMLRIHQDLARPIGLRAALELAWLAGQTLIEAAENGSVQGCFSHAGLTPWRLALRSDGQVQVIGYGLPQVDVLAHRMDRSWVVDADSLRYAPPERLSGVAEDPSADTCALTLIAYEVITGQPLYPGHDLATVHPMVSMSEGATILSRPNDLPRPVAQVFARSLIFDPDARLSGRAWVDEVGNLLDHHQEGDSLEVVADRLRGTRREGPRRAAKLVATETGEFTAGQIQDAVAEPEARTGPETRWSRPARERKPAPTPAGASGVATSGGDASTRRRRRRGEEPPAEAAATPAPASLRARPDGGPPAVAAPPDARRRRRNPALAVPEEEDAPGGLPELPLDVDDEDGDDLLLDPAETHPTEPDADPESRPRVRRRAEAESTGDVPAPMRRRRRREDG